MASLVVGAAPAGLEPIDPLVVLVSVLESGTLRSGVSAF